MCPSLTAVATIPARIRMELERAVMVLRPIGAHERIDEELNLAGVPGADQKSERDGRKCQDVRRASRNTGRKITQARRRRRVFAGRRRELAESPGAEMPGLPFDLGDDAPNAARGEHDVLPVLDLKPKQSRFENVLGRIEIDEVADDRLVRERHVPEVERGVVEPHADQLVQILGVLRRHAGQTVRRDRVDRLAVGNGANGAGGSGSFRRNRGSRRRRRRRRRLCRIERTPMRRNSWFHKPVQSP